MEFPSWISCCCDTTTAATAPVSFFSIWHKLQSTEYRIKKKKMNKREKLNVKEPQNCDKL